MKEGRGSEKKKATSSLLLACEGGESSRPAERGREEGGGRDRKTGSISFNRVSLDGRERKRGKNSRIATE